MKIILLANGTKPGVVDAIKKLRPEIEKHAEILDVDFSGQKDFTRVRADIAIVFGGDGSILRSVNQLGHNQIPVLAVHLGTLGFLTSIQLDELVPLLSQKRLLALPVIQHLLLNCTVLRPPKTEKQVTEAKAETDLPVMQYLVLNEVVLHSGHAARMMSVAMSIDGELVTIYRCDGLIVSTPVGSTALNLSTGGPILRKDIDAVVISPISPHTLSNRPLVDSPDRCFELQTRQPATLILDGNEITTIEPSDRIRITRSEQTFKMIDVPGSSYYKTLREKLGWNGSFEGIAQ
jgi:NAD+ kinase